MSFDYFDKYKNHTLFNNISFSCHALLCMSEAVQNALRQTCA
jgi:hypothetical protein